MSISETHICRLALFKIGCDGTFSNAFINTMIEPQNKTERVLADWYHQARKYVLRAHTWNFATKTFPMEEQVINKTIKLRLPADFIRFASNHSYIVKENYLYVDPCNSCAIRNCCCCCEINYIYDCNQTGLFSPDFVQIFVLYLASQICYHLTGNKALADSLYQEYLLNIERAKSIDTQDSSLKLRVRHDKGRLHKRLYYRYC